jgi:hypothetical protein
MVTAVVVVDYSLASLEGKMASLEDYVNFIGQND